MPIQLQVNLPRSCNSNLLPSFTDKPVPIVVFYTKKDTSSPIDADVQIGERSAVSLRPGLFAYSPEGFQDAHSVHEDSRDRQIQCVAVVTIYDSHKADTKTCHKTNSVLFRDVINAAYQSRDEFVREKSCWEWFCGLDTTVEFSVSRQDESPSEQYRLGYRVETRGLTFLEALCVPSSF